MAWKLNGIFFYILDPARIFAYEENPLHYSIEMREREKKILNENEKWMSNGNSFVWCLEVKIHKMKMLKKIAFLSLCEHYD